MMALRTCTECSFNFAILREATMSENGLTNVVCLLKAIQAEYFKVNFLKMTLSRYIPHG